MGNEQSCAPCNSGWAPHSIQGTTHCLKHIGDGLIKDAESACFKIGGILPVPENEQQNQDYYKAFELQNKQGSFKVVALGLNDIVTKGSYIKLDGNQGTYFNWSSFKTLPQKDEKFVGSFKLLFIALF